MADNQPFLPFFVGDFLGATVTWEGEERALYMLMLAYQWSGGALPSNLEKLSRTLGYPHDRFMALWSTVGEKFESRGKTLLNERLERHREKSKEISSARSHAGSVGGKASAAKRAELAAKMAATQETNLSASAEAKKQANVEICNVDPQAKEEQISTIHPIPSHPDPIQSIPRAQSASAVDRECGNDRGTSSPRGDAGGGSAVHVLHPTGDSPPDPVDRIRAAYPERRGRTDWDRAAHFCHVLIERHGQTWDSLEAACRRYAAYCDATSATRTQHAMMPGNFFGASDKPWSQPWELPEPPDSSSTKKPVIGTWRPSAEEDAGNADR